MYRAFHRVRPMWALHKVHHAPPVLTPVTAIRMHPLEHLFYAPVIPLAQFLYIVPFVYLFGMPSIVGFIMSYSFEMLVLHPLHHSHVWVGFGRLSYLFTSPAMHQIHHSKDPKHFDKNLASWFSGWDWLFGTLFVPTAKDREELQLGLRDQEDFTAGEAVLTPMLEAIGRVPKKATRHQGANWGSSLVQLVLLLSFCASSYFVFIGVFIGDPELYEKVWFSIFAVFFAGCLFRFRSGLKSGAASDVGFQPTTDD